MDPCGRCAGPGVSCWRLVALLDSAERIMLAQLRTGPYEPAVQHWIEERSKMCTKYPRTAIKVA